MTQNLKPVIITGPSGTGKSIQLSRVTHAPLMLTSTTSHMILQLSVESKLEKIRKNMLDGIWDEDGCYSCKIIEDNGRWSQRLKWIDREKKYLVRFSSFTLTILTFCSKSTEKETKILHN